ncbi:MAG: hypothetical protein HQM16_10245 [Deltaproteobacteria bacterium]|nr:hypothetical protein [Deltaproteobacteria bacterium]
MKKLLFASALVTGFVFLSVAEVSSGTVSKVFKKGTEANGSIPTIAHSELFKLERAPVVFNHDAHNEVLGYPDCTTCHRQDAQGQPAYTFYNDEEAHDKTLFMQRYHSSCIRCHEVESKGPVICAECHNKDNAPYTSKVFFEHSKHREVLDKGCNSCHPKGREERPCTACHQKTDADTLSLRKIYHKACFDCHYKSNHKQQRCAQCHDASVNHQIKVVAHSYSKTDVITMTNPGNTMSPVIFDHKKHERVAGHGDSCRGCHTLHVRSIDHFKDFEETSRFCADCHKKAGLVPEESSKKLYHDENVATSCVGCHKQSGRGPLKDKCSNCHQGQERAVQIHVQAGDSVMISSISEIYEPVAFPHKMHEVMIGCESCHHNSPKNQKPACRMCHAQSDEFHKLDKPGLRGAYHRQCVDCHEHMQKGPVKCVDCHAKKEAR